MKLYKLFIFIFAAAWLTACSDDDDVKNNTAPGVTVEFASDSLITKEGQSVARLPFKITGEPNGKIRVQIEVTEAVGSTSPALEDVHYYVTTKTYWIYPDVENPAFEIVPVDDTEMNDPRTFIVKITSVEYAEAGVQQEAIGYIRDNDTLPYDRLTGDWVLTCLEEGADYAVPFAMTNFDESDFRFERVLEATGDWMGVGASSTITLQFNKSGNFVTLMAGAAIVEGINFTGFGPCNVYLAVPAAGMPSLKGGIDGNWNDDFSEVSFGNQQVVLFVQTTSDNNTEYGPNTPIGTYATWSNIKFVRPTE